MMHFHIDVNCRPNRFNGNFSGGYNCIEFIVTLTDGGEDVDAFPRAPATMAGARESSCHPYMPAGLFSSLILDKFINL